jgi:transposase
VGAALAVATIAAAGKHSASPTSFDALFHGLGDPVCRRLMTAPGVGAVVALTYRATVDQPQRFMHSRAVGAHVGLTPKRYQSGEVDYDGRVSKCGDALLRTMLYEANIRCSPTAGNGHG